MSFKLILIKKPFNGVANKPLALCLQSRCMVVHDSACTFWQPKPTPELTPGRSANSLPHPPAGARLWASENPRGALVE